VLLHYPAKQETQKLRLFTWTRFIALPTNTFKLSPGRCWVTLHSQSDRLYHHTMKTYLEREHSILLSVTRTLYVCLPSLSRCRSLCKRSCSLSSLEWKLMDGINGISYYFNKCQTPSNTSQMTIILSGRQCIGAHTLCVQHSPTAAALSTSFLLNHVPNNPN